MKKRDIYQEVTDRIIGEMEAGRLPWAKPWKSTETIGMPANASTGKCYSGANVLLLWITALERNYDQPRWLTFKQALALGGCVRKGEKGTTIVYADKFIPKKERETLGDDAKPVFFLKPYTVFNIEQCDGLPADLFAIDEPLADLERDAAADRLIAATGAKIKHGGDQAFYMPGQDTIALPPMGAFIGTPDYYATAFHELVHWTGAEHRLNRNLRNRFGSKDYAREELVAEMGAAFLCAGHGFKPQARHSDYLAGWLEVLKEDKHAIFKAASLATKAATFIEAGAPAETALAA